MGSILGGVLGGGGDGHQQQSVGYGGYQPSGGLGSQQPSGGGDFLSGLGGSIGSSLLSSALDGLTKHVSKRIVLYFR